MARWDTLTLTPLNMGLNLEYPNPNPHQDEVSSPKPKSSWVIRTPTPMLTVSTKMGYPNPHRAGVSSLPSPIPFQECYQEMQRQAPGGGSAAVAGAGRGSAGAE